MNMKKEKKSRNIKNTEKREIETKKVNTKENFEDELIESQKENNKDESLIEDSIKKSDSQNKTLRNILIGIGIISVLFLVIVFFINSTKQFEYRGVKFNNIKEGDLILYQTSIPVKYNDKTTGKTIDADYNFYLRNDPRKLDKIPFNGEIILSKNMVINSSGNFNCNGDGIIGVANLVKLYEILGVNVIKDPNATCDELGRYMFVQMQSGETTSVEKTGPICYTININNCEILKATEKLMIEIFVRFNEVKK